MYFDSITIMALVDEFTKTLIGGRIQDTVEIDEDSIGLEIYANHQRHYLQLSAHQQFARVYLSDEKLRRGVQTPSPLGLLLRRYAEGAHIDAVHQPDWERVLIFDLDGPEGTFQLIAEPMERRANILLVRHDQTIVECIRRVGVQDNRIRQSLPGYTYQPPPPQKLKRDPLTLTQTLLADMLEADPGEKAQQVLTKRLLGFSPMVAKEAVFRATGAVNTRAADTSARTLLDVIHDLFGAFGEGQWQPGMTMDEQGMPTAYAVYPVTYLEGWTPVDRVSEAVERYYGPLVGEGAYSAAKKPIQEQINEAKERLTHKLEALQRSLQDDASLEHLRLSGELLLAYQYTLQPGQTVLRTQYEVDGPELDIKIDPTMSPLDNAKDYFERYDKAKRARAGVPELIEAVEQELGYLGQLETDLDLAANWPEIGEVQDALQANGYWKGTRTVRPGGSKSGPLKVTMDGWVIWVGRNARQNDTVTFDKGSPDDLWLHIHGVPGAHVIIKSAGRSVPDAVIRRAASLAVYYSSARTEGHALVDVTQRKHVRKIKGGKPGMVTYRNETPVDAVPAPE